MARRKSEATDGDDAAPDPAEAAAGSSPEVRAEPQATEPSAEPETAAEVPLDEYHEEPHEEGGRSFAARALTVLLLLLAGAALGIWGAPKLAPMLPSGLAPVADWLTPGRESAEARVAELESRLDASLGEVESRLGTALADLPTADDLESRVTAAIGELESRTNSEIGGLRDSVASLDGAETRQRIARAESAIDGQAAELAAIKEQITGGAAAAVGTLSEETTERIDLYRAELDGLRAEMGSLSDEVAALASRIDSVAADADRQIETARSQAAQAEAQAETKVGAATVEADLAQVRAALAAGLPFDAATERLAGQSSVSIPEPLLAVAEGGVTPLPALRDSFPDAAHAAIQASIMASAGDGVFARSRAFLEAQVASRSLTPQDGMTPDAVLSRMEDSLRHDDLAGALQEAGQLPTEAAAAMSGWLGAAQSRLDAEAALATLEAGHAATN